MFSIRRSIRMLAKVREERRKGIVTNRVRQVRIIDRVVIS
jgi:hypothetical protein